MKDIVGHKKRLKLKYLEMVSTSMLYTRKQKYIDNTLTSVSTFLLYIK